MSVIDNARIPRTRPFLAAAARFGSGDDTPRAFLERCLEAHAAWEPEIGAFVHINIDDARVAADASTARWRGKRPLSMIDGMPVGVKDIIETADMPTEMGSPLFEGWRSGWDSAAVTALREAGAVVLGKTVTTEFAATEPRGTRNPWDLARTPGGSSSGSAAAVAAGLVTAALGTQVVGSIVRPASYCGCVGFKPSVGAINRGGSHDYLSQSCTGVLAASLEDAWQVSSEIAARVGGDPGFVGLAGSLSAPLAVKPVRVVLLETAGWPSASPAARHALQSVVARLADASVEIMTRSSHPQVATVEEAIVDAHVLSGKINAWESRWPLTMYRKRDAGKLSSAMLRRLDQGEAMSVDDYRAALAERRRIRGLYEELSASCDVCVTLAAPGAAPVGIESTGDPAFAVPFSLLGVPALSLPVMREHDLPLGLQVTGFKNRDAAVFAAAAWLKGELEEQDTQRTTEGEKL
jgi:Asp-tRNA(Asn)/Glu-tRNA(Gln) amidotransferase A subunit family amidase